MVANRAYGIASSRLPIIERLREQGFNVVAAGSPDSSIDSIVASGARFEEVNIRRGGLKAGADVAAFAHLCRLIAKERPDALLLFNTKPILLAGLAAWVLRTGTVVNTVTGRGYGLNGTALVASVLKTLYRIVLRYSAQTVFQNPDDLEYFVSRGLIPPGKARLVMSSGVDISRFSASARNGSETITVSFAGRLVWQKGVREFVEMAERLGPRYPNVEFMVGGELDPSHPDAVPESWIREKAERGVFQFVGYVHDMPTFLEETDIFVLPSAFGEGLPRVVIEAGAMRVPTVTTDTEGCRAAVKPGETGLLVPPGDAEALTEAVASLIADDGLRRRMGESARTFVVKTFDRTIVLERLFGIYRDAGILVA